MYTLYMAIMLQKIIRDFKFVYTYSCTRRHARTSVMSTRCKSEWELNIYWYRLYAVGVDNLPCFIAFVFYDLYSNSYICKIT